MREMTIARGLTRLKTIKAQLERIGGSIKEYAYWNDKQKCPIVRVEESLAKNHEACRAEIAAMVQQYEDLLTEYQTIKRAIDLTNLQTRAEICGRQMTLHEALSYKSYLGKSWSSISSSLQNSRWLAESSVENYNARMAKNIEDVQARNSILANVTNFVPVPFAKKAEVIANEFMAELDGRLNELNAVTMLMFD